MQSIDWTICRLLSVNLPKVRFLFNKMGKTKKQNKNYHNSGDIKWVPKNTSGDIKPSQVLWVSFFNLLLLFFVNDIGVTWYLTNYFSKRRRRRRRNTKERILERPKWSRVCISNFWKRVLKLPDFKAGNCIAKKIKINKISKLPPTGNNQPKQKERRKCA